MTERSRPWDGTTTGDATDAPYDAATEWARMFRACLPRGEQSPNKGGVVMGAAGLGGYAASSPGANTVRISTGVGWVQGTWHESDANVDIAIPSPSVSTRIDRIALRKSWASQTVRLVRSAGVEGGGVPALTQVFGTTWDVPLWQASITTGGVITYTDERLDLVQGRMAEVSGAYNATIDDNLILQHAAAAVTMMLANSVPRGWKCDVKSTIAGASVARSGSDTFWSFAAGQTSVPLAAGDDATVRSDGVSVWYVT